MGAAGVGFELVIGGVGFELEPAVMGFEVIPEGSISDMGAAGLKCEIEAVKFGLSVVEPAVENPGEEEQDPGSSSLDSGCQQN